MKDLTLERHDMHNILSRGESVLLNGELVTRHEDLPSAVTLAKDDPEELARVRKDLVARQKELQRQIAEADALAAALEEGQEDKEENEIADEDTDDVGGTNPKPIRRRPAPLGQRVVTPPQENTPGQNALTGEDNA